MPPLDLIRTRRGSRGEKQRSPESTDRLVKQGDDNVKKGDAWISPLGHGSRSTARASVKRGPLKPKSL